MARRRKQTSGSRQLSLFDIMVSHIEQIREENIQDDIRACLETHLSIMKRFSSMLAMAI